MSLDIQIKEDPSQTVVTLRGSLVAGAKAIMANAFKTVRSKQLVFDFEDITIINSSGIGEWSEFIGEHLAEVSFSFRHCPPNVVDTINLLPSFLAHGHVESMFVDYQCGECNHEDRVELTLLRDVTPAGEIRPKVACIKCKATMTTISPEDDLFGFFNQP